MLLQLHYYEALDNSIIIKNKLKKYVSADGLVWDIFYVSGQTFWLESLPIMSLNMSHCSFTVYEACKYGEFRVDLVCLNFNLNNFFEESVNPLNSS
jgi:hypothetical protein